MATVLNNKYNILCSPFEFCEFEQDGLNSDSKELKKSLKAIREILILEEKPKESLNKEQIEKISKKSYHEKIVRGYSSEYLKDQENKKQREIEEGRKKREEEHQKKKILSSKKSNKSHKNATPLLEKERIKQHELYFEFIKKQKQEDEFRKREEDEFRKQQEDEFRKREEDEFRKREEAKKSQKHQKRNKEWKQEIDSFENTVIHEYMATYKELNNDTRKTFIKLSLKYHPDKNVGNEEWASRVFQIMSNWHDNFILKN